MKYVPILAAIGIVLLLIRIFRPAIIKWLYRLRARLHIQSLRQAISDADGDKEQTQRKNMVVYNTAIKEFEPLQKQLLKAAERAGKNKNNAKMTDGRKRVLKRKKKLLQQDVKMMEKKSLYVTK